MTQSPEQGVTVTLPAQPVGAEFSVTLEGVTVRENPLYSERIRKILTLCNANNSKKSATYQGLKGKQTREAAVAAAKRVKNRKVRAWLLEALHNLTPRRRNHSAAGRSAERRMQSVFKNKLFVVFQRFTCQNVRNLLDISFRIS